MNQEINAFEDKSPTICISCNNFGLERLTTSKSFGVDIIKCSSCGLIQSEYVSDSALKDYYNSFYRVDLNHNVIEILRRKSKAQAKAQMDYIIPFINDIGQENALDYGAGDGELALLFKDKFNNIYVSETDPQYLSLLERLNNINILTDQDLLDPRYNNFFDFISISHVLEHLPDPASSLDIFASSLETNGLLLIDIPNEAELIESHNFQAKGHLTFFNLNTFQNFINYHGGFSIVDIKTCNHSVQDFIQSGFTLPEEHFRLDTPDGTVIRAVLQKTGQERYRTNKGNDSLYYKRLLDSYSHRILRLNERVRTLEKDNNRSSWDNKIDSPDSEINESVKRLQIEIPTEEKNTFILDLETDKFSHQMICDESIKYGLYEPDTSRLVTAILKKGDWMIDVGAHIGYFSLFSSTMVGDKGRIISFEPIDENLNHLDHNIKINNAKNIEVIKGVVSKQGGETTFYYNSDNDGGHAIWDVAQHEFNKQSRSNPQPLNLPMFSLDQFFSDVDLSPLKLIKIDTEGNELNVLTGAQNLLKNYRIKCIVCELNKFGLNQMGHSEIELRDFMLSLGYERFIFLDKKLTRLKHDQYIKSDGVIEQYFMPQEFCGNMI